MSALKRRILLGGRVLIIGRQDGWVVMEPAARRRIGWLCDCVDGTWIADLDNGHYLGPEFPSAEAAVRALLGLQATKRAS